MKIIKYHYFPTRMDVIKNIQTIRSINKDMEKLEPLYESERYEKMKCL